MNTNNEQMTLEQARPFLLGFVVTHRDQDKALCDAIEVLLAATVGMQQPDALELAHLRATEVAYETLKAELAAEKPSTASAAAQGEPVAWRVVNRRLQRSTPWQDVAIAPIPKEKNWAEGWEIEPAYLAPPPTAGREVPEEVDWESAPNSLPIVERDAWAAGFNHCRYVMIAAAPAAPKEGA